MRERQTEEQLRIAELMVAPFWLANRIVRNLGRTERLCFVILLLQLSIWEMGRIVTDRW